MSVENLLETECITESPCTDIKSSTSSTCPAVDSKPSLAEALPSRKLSNTVHFLQTATLPDEESDVDIVINALSLQPVPDIVPLEKKLDEKQETGWQEKEENYTGTAEMKQSTEILDRTEIDDEVVSDFEDIMEDNESKGLEERDSRVLNSCTENHSEHENLPRTSTPVDSKLMQQPCEEMAEESTISNHLPSDNSKNTSGFMNGTHPTIHSNVDKFAKAAHTVLSTVRVLNAIKTSEARKRSFLIGSVKVCYLNLRIGAIGVHVSCSL